MDSKLNKILDLMIEGTIDNDTYSKKKANIDYKIDRIEREIEQYTTANGEDEKNKKGLKKIEELLNSKKYFDEFDADVFHALVDCVIIGGRIDGELNRCLIRFICKTNFNRNVFKSLTNEKIKDNCDIIDGKSKDYMPIIDFMSPQQYYLFEKDDKGEMRKTLIREIRVRFEVENSCVS